jgi:hypothetical protein
MSRRTRKILLIFLFTITFIVLSVLFDQFLVWRGRQILIAHDTTRITSPIEPNGCPDYLAALNTQLATGVTPDNNAAPLLLQITGTAETSPVWQPAIHKFLNLPSAPFPRKLTFIIETQYAARGKTGNPTNEEFRASHDDEDAAASAPWDPADYPDRVAWLNANREALEIFHEAAKRPRYYIPLLSKTGNTAHLDNETFISLPVPPLGYFRHIATTALARAMMNLHDQNADAAGADILDTARLARLLAQAPSLIEYFVALAIDQQASRAVQVAAATNDLSPTDLAALDRDFAALPHMPPPDRQIDSLQRSSVLDIICKFARVGTVDSGPDPSPFRFTPVNFNRCLRVTNHHFDAILAGLPHPSFTDREKAFDEIPLNASTADGNKAERALIALGRQNLRSANILYTTTLAHRQLALTALALRAHKQSTGKFPATLADLPKSTPTTDPFTDHPLVYKPTPTGYLLYSVGPNQKDDAGAPRVPKGPAARDYDLPLQIPQ